jgi:hypothetical protein
MIRTGKELKKSSGIFLRAFLTEATAPPVELVKDFHDFHGRNPIRSTRSIPAVR